MAQKTKKHSNPLELLAGLIIVAGSSFINPWTSFDAVNIPRLIAVSIIGSISTFYVLKIIISNWTDLLKLKSQILMIFAGSGFLISLISSLVFSGTSISSQVYGTQGRFTGFLALVSLFFTMILFSLRGYECRVNRVSIAVYSGGLINVIYGIVQYLGLDPVDWQNLYGPIVGTLGNPNFMSSFLGLFGIFITFILSNQFIGRRNNLLYKFWNLVLLLLVIFLIQETGSIQGFFVLLSGSTIVLMGKIQSKLLNFRFVTLIVLILTLPIIFIGFAGYGPLARLLYQSTLEVRFFYWRAALKMIADKPLTGFGLDSFGEWYTTFRDEISASTYGPNLLTNSAHNVFLDMGAFGGLPLLITYFSLTLIITVVGFKHLLGKRLTQPLFNLSFALWVGYVAQTLISIHHLGLSLIGNLFGAVAFSLANHNIEGKKDLSKLEFRQIGLLPTVASGLVGLILVFPVARNDIDFRSAIYEKEGQRIYEVVNRWPKNEFHLILASRLFYLGKNSEVGRELARLALATNPRSREALILLLQDDSLGQGEKSEISRQIKEIDPFGTN